MANCPHCDAIDAGEAGYCKKCGQPLETAAIPVAAAPARRTSGMAVASLVLGILSLLCLFPAAVLAIVLGYGARARIRRSAGTLQGEGMARAGVNLGVLGLIFFVLAAIAIPNLIRSRMSSGEWAPVSGVRTINTAEVTYASTYPKIGFSPTLEALGYGGTDCHQSTEQHACLIDDMLAAGQKRGYRFRYTPAPPEGGVVLAYTIQADPSPEPASWLERLFGAQPQTGTRHFFSDQSGVIRYEAGHPATANSPPLN